MLIKSFTVKAVSIGLSIISFMITMQQDIIDVMIFFGASEMDAQAVFKVIGLISAALTFIGVAKGRLDAETKPRLNDRN